MAEPLSACEFFSDMIAQAADVRNIDKLIPHDVPLKYRMTA